MRKRIFFSIVVFCLILGILSSCLPGIAVSLNDINRNNLPRAVLVKKPAYIETLTYYVSGMVSYRYGIYIENNSSGRSFNVFEQHEEVMLYAYEGEIYMKDGDKLYAILQASGTYAEYVEKYMTFKSLFDECTYYQIYSKKADGITEVCYEAEPSTEVLNQAVSLGIKPGCKLGSVYYIDDESKLVNKIEYYYRNSSNESEKTQFLTREFTYLDAKRDLFSSLPDLSDTFGVYIVYNPGKETESKSHFSIPNGCKIGIDTNGKNISFYEDKECTVPFDFDTYSAEGKDEVYIYALFN